MGSFFSQEQAPQAASQSRQAAPQSGEGGELIQWVLTGQEPVQHHGHDFIAHRDHYKEMITLLHYLLNEIEEFDESYADSLAPALANLVRVQTNLVNAVLSGNRLSNTDREIMRLTEDHLINLLDEPVIQHDGYGLDYSMTAMAA